MLINRLIHENAFRGHEVLLLEQTCLLPRKTALDGLRIYCRKAGYSYVALQILKQYTFIFRRFLARILRRRMSPCFPYWLHRDVNLRRSSSQTIYSHAAEQELRAFAPDLILSLLSKEILSESLIRLPRLGAINVHPAPLPKYRGVSPTFWALVNREHSFGATVHALDVGIDTGDIIGQAHFSITDCTTEHAIYRRAIEASVPLLVSCLRECGDHAFPHRITQTGASSSFSLPTKVAYRQLRAQGGRLFSFQELFS